MIVHEPVASLQRESRFLPFTLIKRPDGVYDERCSRSGHLSDGSFATMNKRIRNGTCLECPFTFNLSSYPPLPVRALDYTRYGLIAHDVRILWTI